MELRLTIILVIINLLFMLFVYSNLKRNKILLKYALLWIGASILFIICAVTPNLMKSMANFMGIETTSNMIFLFVIGAILVITFALTTIVSTQKAKITMLVQEVGILKERIDRGK